MKKSKHLKVAIEAAKAASVLLLTYYDKGIKVNFKKENEVVTIADKKSEKLIIKMIKEVYPNHSIWGEESPEEKNNSDYRWIIDPLDGTATFVQGLPFWGIVIALEYKGEVIAGVSYFPLMNRMYYTEKGKGAYLNGNCIKVSDKKTSDNLYFLTSSELFRHPKHLKPFLKKLQARKLNLKSLGSTALDFGLVAEGKADACLEYQIKPCDISVGRLLIEEAGGVIMEPNGKRAAFDSKKIVAHNGNLRRMLLNI